MDVEEGKIDTYWIVPLSAGGSIWRSRRDFNPFVEEFKDIEKSGIRFWVIVPLQWPRSEALHR